MVRMADAISAAHCVLFDPIEILDIGMVRMRDMTGLIPLPCGVAVLFELRRGEAVRRVSVPSLPRMTRMGICITTKSVEYSRNFALMLVQVSAILDTFDDGRALTHLRSLKSGSIRTEIWVNPDRLESGRSSSGSKGTRLWV